MAVDEPWIPAAAGMTVSEVRAADPGVSPREGGGPGQLFPNQAPGALQQVTDDCL